MISEFIKKMKQFTVTTKIFFSVIIFFIINENYQFLDFFKIIVWPLYFLGLFIIFRQPPTVNKDTKNLLKDESQAKKIFRIFQSKCQDRKAIMISGKWGIGKTSFYQASLRKLFENNFPNMKIIELSCFGIVTANDLLSEILDKMYMMELFGVFFSYIKQIITSTTNFKRSLIPSHLIIVVDDFERFSGNFSELLGIFDYLIHQKYCHIIILCNDNEISNEEYRKFLEKIIVKQEFEISSETIRKILESNVFLFNNSEYHFSTSIINQFIQILNRLPNIRNAWDAHVDMKEITTKFMEKLKEINNISEEKKLNG